MQPSLNSSHWQMKVTKVALIWLIYQLLHIHYISSLEHVSFNPVHTTPHNTVTMTPHSSPQTPTRPVHQHLSFSSDSDQDPDSTPVYSDNSDEEEEDFQMVPLDD